MTIWNEDELARLATMRSDFAAMLGMDDSSLVDVSVEDELVCIPLDAVRTLVRRTRKREVLVGQLTSLLLPYYPGPENPDVFTHPALARLQLAQQIIDALGVALLVSGDKPQTATMMTGENESMSEAEFAAREGVPTRCTATHGDARCMLRVNHPQVMHVTIDGDTWKD